MFGSLLLLSCGGSEVDGSVCVSVRVPVEKDDGADVSSAPLVDVVVAEVVLAALTKKLATKCTSSVSAVPFDHASFP